MPKAPKSEALLEAGRIEPVKVRLPLEDKVEELAPDETFTEFETNIVLQAVPRLPTS